MAKWLAAGTIALIALLALLWMQIREPSAQVNVAAKQDVQPAAAPTAIATPADLAIAAQKARELQAQGGKIDPKSDAFTYRFDERVSPSLLMNAAGCYTGGMSRVHRNQSTKLEMKIQIKNGVFSVKDVKVASSSISDKALNDCFVREVAKTTWVDEQLPDWEQDEELVISPERGMKKFTKENMAYEGDGPITKGEAPVPVAASREQPLDERDQ